MYLCIIERQWIITTFLEDVVLDLQETLNIAKKAGISKDTIILDPGVGFC